MTATFGCQECKESSSGVCAKHGTRLSYITGMPQPRLAKKQYLLVLLEDRTEDQVEDAIKTIRKYVPNVFSIQHHEPVFRSAQIEPSGAETRYCHCIYPAFDSLTEVCKQCGNFVSLYNNESKGME